VRQKQGLYLPLQEYTIGCKILVPVSSAGPSTSGVAPLLGLRYVMRGRQPGTYESCEYMNMRTE
jgi:hypothetical protein